MSVKLAKASKVYAEEMATDQASEKMVAESWKTSVELEMYIWFGQQSELVLAMDLRWSSTRFESCHRVRRKELWHGGVEALTEFQHSQLPLCRQRQTPYVRPKPSLSEDSETLDDDIAHA